MKKILTGILVINALLGFKFVSAQIVPSITQNPISQSVNVGQNALFFIIANGDPTDSLIYQWQKDGVDMGGQNNDSLVFIPGLLSDTGSYRCIVTSFLGFGSDTSSASYLEVKVIPSILVQPQGGTLLVGDTLLLTISANSYPAPNFQWRKYGVNLPGETNDTLMALNVSLGDSGVYTCLISSSDNQLLSNPALVNVYDLPNFIVNPISQTVDQYDTLILTASVTGFPSPIYQWQFNGVDLIGETNDSLVLNSIQPNQVGNYTCVAFNFAGVASSTIAVVNVIPSVLTLNIDSVSNIWTDSAVIFVSYVNTYKYFQTIGWTRFDTSQTAFDNMFPGLSIPVGSGQLTVTLDSLLSGETYYAKIYGFVLGVFYQSITNPSSFTTLDSALILNSIPDDVVIVGDTISYSVNVKGTSFVLVNWYHNGVLINSGNVLDLNNVALLDSGIYTVVASNAINSDTITFNLSVLMPPVFTTNPISQTVNLGASMNFISSANAYPNPSYQWYHDNQVISGAISPVFTLVNTTALDSGLYYCVATNLAGSDTSVFVTLSVNLPPSVVTNPISQTLVQGDTAIFSVIYTGTNPIQIDWYFEGILIPSATDSNPLIIPNVDLSNVGNYYATLSNMVTSVNTVSASLTVHTIPVFTLEPFSSQSVNEGGLISFSSLAISTPSPSYQWYHNNQIIVGATNQNLDLVNVMASDEGSYYCVATNLVGSDTTSVIDLTVYLPPSVVTNPSSQIMVEGDTAIFSVTYTGSETMFFDWHHDGAIVASNVNPLIIPNVSLLDTGSYYVSLTNMVTTVNSLSANLTVYTYPVVTLNPLSDTLDQSDTLVLVIQATGFPVPTYQWQFNGVDLSGETNDTLIVNGIEPNQAGGYSVVVSNQAGSVSSDTANIVVLPSVLILTLDSISNIWTDSAQVFVSYVNTYKYEQTILWAGFGLDSISFSNLTPAESIPVGSGQLVITLDSLLEGITYYVKASGFNSQTSGPISSLNSLSFTTLKGAMIDTDPVSDTLVEGGTVIFSVIASGTDTLSYQWQVNGMNIPGETDDSLIITPAVLADTGNYACIVSNFIDQDTSAVATLTVYSKPVFVLNPLSQTVNEGASVTFTTSATAIPSPSYAWYHNGLPVLGANNSNLTLLNAFALDSGLYYCVATNLVGSDTCATVSLGVNLLPDVIVNPVFETVTAGDTATFVASVFGNTTTTLQWYHNGLVLFGETDDTLSFATLPADSGVYSVVVVGVAGTDTANAFLNVVTPPITFSLDSVGSVDASSAIAYLSCNHNYSSTTVAFLNYGKDTNMVQIINYGLVPTGSGQFIVFLNGLDHTTKYYLRAGLSSDGISILTSRDSFMTKSIAPVIVSSSVSNITKTGAMLAVNYVSGGGQATLKVYSGQSSNSLSLVSTMSVLGQNSYYFNFSGLPIGDTTFYKVVISNSLGSDTTTTAFFVTDNYKTEITYFGFTCLGSNKLEANIVYTNDDPNALVWLKYESDSSLSSASSGTFPESLGVGTNLSLNFFVDGLNSSSAYSGSVFYQGTNNVLFSSDTSLCTTDAALNSVELLEDVLFKVYPNPFSLVANILSSVDGRLYLYNSSGRLVDEIFVKEGKGVILRNNLSIGLYLIHFYNEEGKILKQEKILVH